MDNDHLFPSDWVRLDQELYEVDIPMCAPIKRFKIGRYTYSTYTWRCWECSNGCLGSSNHTNPISAFIALKRFEREPNRPS